MTGGSFICGSEGILYPWELFSTFNNFHKGSVDELRTFLEARTKANERLIHLKLKQQHLRLNILHVIKHLAKVIAFLKDTEQSG